MQARCLAFLGSLGPVDSAHDISHIKRVIKNTRYLTDFERAEIKITLPAACLHDCVNVPKDSPKRSESSRLAAERAAHFLNRIDYPGELIPAVAHAIEAHSFSAKIPCRTIEACVVQDADRLDALGAIGIARCMLVGGKLGRPLLDPDDPFCDHRDPDDGEFTLDHFYTKLLKLPATMQTESGRREAQRRADIMRRFLDDLRSEVL
ncbi:MAG: HD domain-containing protein [Gammaproteobacteria bacterium]|nr:HD domain-containing protein [Gammaproteobacteria bacterium]